MSPPLLAITIDVEWAPPLVVQKMLALLEKHEICATLFCTDAPDLEVAEIHEVALHPNFHGEADWAKTFDVLRRRHPHAVGLRSHCLHSDTRLIRLLPSWGMRYQSNLFAPGQSVAPFRRETGLWEIPIHYMDFFHLCVPDRYPDGFHAASLPAGLPLLVVDFHPIPWMINASCLSDYEQSKGCYHDPAKLTALRRPGIGIASVFEELIAEVLKGRWRCVTLREAVERMEQAPQQTLWRWPCSTDASSCR